MKKVIVLMNEFFGYEKKIMKELEKNNFEVKYFNYIEILDKYKRETNIFIRIVNNIFFKPFRNKNLKEELAIKKINKLLEKEENQGYAIIKIGAINLDKSTLEIIKKNYSLRILHYWDTIGTFFKEKDYYNEKIYFNKISSYDRRDCSLYDLKYLPNFYYNNIKNKENIKKIYTVMSDISKKNILEKIAKILIEKKLDYEIILITQQMLKSNLITIQKKFITIDEMQREMQKSSVILELNREGNKGYTFRTFDCIGMKKKLITNNKNIVNEDFYNPNNILVIDENDISIPKAFIDSPYEELPPKIYEKYSLENWIKQLLEIR